MYRVARAIAWLLATFCFRLRRSGGENIPEQGAAILVCNHVNMLDTACVMLQTRRPMRIMAKKELFQNKLLGWFLSRVGAFPISRGEADVSGIRTAMKALKDGELLCIYPEGTRNRKKEQPLLPLHEGVAMLALRCGVDIIPSWIEGGFVPWKRCTVLTDEKMDLSAYAGVRKPGQEQMQQLTGQIAEAMLNCRARLMKNGML